MEEFQTAIQKFQAQERTKIEQELKEELTTLKQKVAQLTKDNAHLEMMYRKVSENVKTFSASLLNIVNGGVLNPARFTSDEMCEIAVAASAATAAATVASSASACACAAAAAETIVNRDMDDDDEQAIEKTEREKEVVRKARSLKTGEITVAPGTTKEEKSFSPSKPDSPKTRRWRISPPT